MKKDFEFSFKKEVEKHTKPCTADFALKAILALTLIAQLYLMLGDAAVLKLINNLLNSQ